MEMPAARNSDHSTSSSQSSVRFVRFLSRTLFFFLFGMNLSRVTIERESAEVLSVLKCWKVCLLKFHTFSSDARMTPTKHHIFNAKPSIFSIHATNRCTCADLCYVFCCLCMLSTESNRTLCVMCKSIPTS